MASVLIIQLILPFLVLLTKFNRQFDQGDLSCDIFLDFSRAFDSVDHAILIEKLDFYGIRGISKDWFTLYLTNRQQFVAVNDIESDLTSISCGIPQGSVLSAIPFLLYINDFHLCSTLFDFHLFADEANVFFRHKDINILQQNINTELNNVSMWLRSNKLSLNIKKSRLFCYLPCSTKKIYTLSRSVCVCVYTV